jgi:hypothetical protein
MPKEPSPEVDLARVQAQRRGVLVIIQLHDVDQLASLGEEGAGLV